MFKITDVIFKIVNKEHCNNYRQITILQNSSQTQINRLNIKVTQTQYHLVGVESWRTKSITLQIAHVEIMKQGKKHARQQKIYKLGC